MSISADILIKNGLVLTMNPSKEVVRNGTVLIKDSRIIGIGGPDLALQATAEKVIDAAGRTVLPGMINTHTHVPMVAYRGIGNDRRNVIREVMFPLEKALTSPEMVRQATSISAVESSPLALGFRTKRTTVCPLFLS